MSEQHDEIERDLAEVDEKVDEARERLEQHEDPGPTFRDPDDDGQAEDGGEQIAPG